ncbi:MAG: BAX inhibitor protein [Halothiobacillus sp. 24-54-40]|jgi:modulator of FtsH protease|nr:Bax inhibitor-1/YccA family protein [Halothiobacillaceae bacterium]OYY32271.1 MAG: BAX inhibitor protein [Halothiobacillus sp. 35-54-62]OYY54519.1 MAG: BAX inhibitor protein [Halothiobacillus sp. 28-55-5]OYZ86103.1 MAG: BAX inhibitor protein [Halothiobacillus sp. 24-54-40]OZA79231.1 MAG: BAX inhibitor protein [Halothiobacillus sp. 39-53-45]HQS03230.1 Bax inhibitor-1/YccA family protein [Halothiobacillus sp.]
MSLENPTVTGRSESLLATNQLIRNTYLMLSLTLVWSAAMAGVAMWLNVPNMMSLVAMFGSMALIWFVLPRTANSSAGLLTVFAITGLMGLGLGPTINYYLHMEGGDQIVMTALGGTGAIFLALSAYALTTRRDFSFMGGFLMVGMIVVLLAMLGNLFFHLPALSMALSAAVILLMSGFILYDTSRMVNGGADNYLMMTVSLYLNIYNIFVSLLNLLGASRD